MKVRKGFGSSLVIVLGMGLGISTAAQASSADFDTQYHSISGGMIEVKSRTGKLLLSRALKVDSNRQSSFSNMPSNKPDFRAMASPNLSIAGGIDPATMVEIGEAIWKFAVDNKSVVTIQNASTHVLPKGIEDPFELDDWNSPMTALVHVVYRNFYRMKVADLQLLLTFQHGGNYHGTGKYLSGVNIEVAEHNVAWGYTMNVQGSVENVVNEGSRTQPIAAATVKIGWSLSSILTNRSDMAKFHVRGDGKIITLN